MNQLHLIGITPDRRWIAPIAMELIHKADVMGGPDRLLAMFPEFKGQTIRPIKPIEKWLHELKGCQERGQKVVVLTTGDPGYFGLCGKFFEFFNTEQVTIIPSLTVVQLAFAKLKSNWEGTEVVSLNGRESSPHFWSALYRANHYQGTGYLAVYTDGDNNPMVIAKRLLGRGQHNWRMIVFENLGTDDEKISSWSLFEAKLRKFSPLNLVVLQSTKPPAPISIGMPESVYVHEAGLITKREVRAVTLALLELKPSHTLWDLGAGSGSISIEATALLPHGSIWSVEKSPLRSEQIAANRAYFGAAQVEIIEDDPLAAITHLPRPDRIFIGSDDEKLGEIITAAHSKLNDNGIIVTNVSTVDNLNLATTVMTNLGLTVTVTQVQAARSEEAANSLYLKALNQVWIVRGTAN